MRLVNDGAEVDAWSIQLDVTRYDGPIGSLPGATGWQDTQHIHGDRPWRRGESRTFVLKVRALELPEPGNYALRLSVARFDPLPGQPGAMAGSENFYAVVFERFRVHPNTYLGAAAAGGVTVTGGVAALVRSIL